MYSFTGSSRSRPLINLGGHSDHFSPRNPSEIMRKAKEERQLREALKRQQLAVSTIQVQFDSDQQTFHHSSNSNTQLH